MKFKNFYFKLFLGRKNPGQLTDPVGLMIGRRVGNWNLYRGLMAGNMFLGKWNFQITTFSGPN